MNCNCLCRFSFYYARRFISTTNRRFKSKVPQVPTWKPITEDQLPPKTEISMELIDHLERLALVDFGNQAGIERLESAIRFADQIRLVNTNNVQPMDTVLEDRSLYMREDTVTQGGCRRQMLKLASKTDEDYYVAPPGNIPYKGTNKPYSSGDKKSGNS